MAFPYAGEHYLRMHAEIAGKPTTGGRSPLSRRTIRQAVPRYSIAESGHLATGRNNRKADIPGDVRLHEVAWA
jgi:hypothetical protein